MTLASGLEKVIAPVSLKTHRQPPITTSFLKQATTLASIDSWSQTQASNIIKILNMRELLPFKAEGRSPI